MKMKALLIGMSLGFMVGCQTVPYKPYARKVKVSPRKGGVVALKLDHNDQDRAKAEQIMTGTCTGTGYDVLEEGEVVIGTQTTSRETQKQGTSGTKLGSLWGIPVTSSGTDPSKNTSSTTLQKKEWQIKYKCAVARKGSRKKTIR